VPIDISALPAAKEITHMKSDRKADQHAMFDSAQIEIVAHDRMALGVRFPTAI